MMKKVDWKNTERVQKKIDFFNLIWETVTAFTNLSKVTSKEWRLLEVKIN